MQFRQNFVAVYAADFPRADQSVVLAVRGDDRLYICKRDFGDCGDEKVQRLPDCQPAKSGRTACQGYESGDSRERKTFAIRFHDMKKPLINQRHYFQKNGRRTRTIP